MHGFKQVVCLFFEGGGGRGGGGGKVKPFRGLGACSTEIRTSEIAKMCASKLLWYTTFLLEKWFPLKSERVHSL